MPRTSLSYFDSLELSTMQQRLLNYHLTQVPSCIASKWSNEVVSGSLTVIGLDERVLGAFTPTELIRNVVFEGESTTDGTGAAPGLDWPTQLKGLGDFDGLYFNQAVASQTIADLVTQYTAQVFPYRPLDSVTEAYLMVMIGIKDAGANRTAVQMFADVEAYIATAQADGFTTVLLTTNYNSSYTAPQKAALADYNASIMSDSISDYVVDILPTVGEPDTQPLNYADAVHQNATGYGIIAEAVNTVLT
jgi:lysophospholipase L1-like esterase